MIDFAHIGLPKSASTFLQNIVFPQHPDIVAIGGNPVKHRIEGQPIEDLWLTEPGDYDLDYARKGFEKLISLYDTKDKVVGMTEECWSGHGITGHNALLAPERIFKVFGKIKIILILRHPVTYIYSQYYQFVKQGGAVTLRSLLDDETFWLKRNIVRKYEYYKLINKLHELFDKDKVLILPLEYLKDDYRGFCRYIYEFLGVKNIEIKNTVVNPSVSKATTGVIRFLNYIDMPKSLGRRDWLTKRIDYYFFRHIFRRPKKKNVNDLIKMQPLFRDVFKDEDYRIWSGPLEKYNYTFNIEKK